jgi:hypothetical protein
VQLIDRARRRRRGRLTPWSTWVVGIAPVGFAAAVSTAYRTSGAAERLSEVALTTANAAIMPAQSMVTLAMTRLPQ